MKIQVLFPIFSFAAIMFASCGDPNKPVQTSTFTDTSGTHTETPGTPAVADSVDNSGKQGLPDQMIPGNSSITVPHGAGK